MEIFSEKPQLFVLIPFVDVTWGNISLQWDWPAPFRWAEGATSKPHWSRNSNEWGAGEEPCLLWLLPSGASYPSRWDMLLSSWPSKRALNLSLSIFLGSRYGCVPFWRWDQQIKWKIPPSSHFITPHLS